MSRPSNPQPFAPTGAQVQYEAPHGLLKLRGGHDQPGTSAYPELDEKGVSFDRPIGHRENVLMSVHRCQERHFAGAV